MRGNFFTVAKVCLAGGFVSALALLLAPLPRASTQVFPHAEPRTASVLEGVEGPDANLTHRFERGSVRSSASTETSKQPPQRVASADTDAPVLSGLAPEGEAASSTDKQVEVTFVPVELPDTRLVPEPTPDPAMPRGSGVVEEIAALKEQVLRLSHANASAAPVGTDLYGEMRQMLDRLTNAERFQKLEDEIRRLQTKNPESTLEQSPVVETPPKPGNSNDSSPLPPAGPFVRAVPSTLEPDRFTLQVEAADVTQVLDLLGEMAGWNVVVAPGVTGVVTLNLRDVTLEEALTSVLAPNDLVAERKDNLLFVFPRTQADLRAEAARVVVTKVYRPSYINVADLQALATPLLTQTIGKIAVTSPSTTGLQLDNTKGGGDTLSQRDALVVQDYPEVIEQIDNIVREMDIPPVQVVIEGYILRVQLRDNMRFGVNLALLGDEGRQLVTTGSGAAIQTSTGFPGERDSLVPPLPQFIGNVAGLRYGFLQGNVSGFIEALESIGETSLVASPSVRVLNKQKAELIIGKRLGYKTQTFNNQQTIENVQFLDVGTKLILRPFAAPDGFVRMEIHPEQSSGSIDINGLPTVETTEVTSNVMVRDGSTVVIGGLIDEQTEEVVEQVPLLGSIPVVGNAFKTTDERLIRSELIVLITPRIVCDPIEEARGEVLRTESEARAAYFTDSLSSVSRRNLARMHTERAVELYDKGRLAEAHDHTRKALAIRNNDGDALRLQGRIEDSMQARRRGLFSWPPTFGRPDPTAGPIAPHPGHATVEPAPILTPPAPVPEAPFEP